jgi:hypothetical protein
MKSTDPTIQDDSEVAPTKASAGVLRRRTTTEEAGKIVQEAFLKAFAERLEKIKRGEKIRER